MTEEALSEEQRALLEHMIAGRHVAATATVPEGIFGERGPLSARQLELWIVDELSPGTPVNNLACVCRIERSIDVDVFRAAIAHVVSRHQALRTTIERRDGPPEQVIARALEPPFSFVDVSAADAPRKAADDAARAAVRDPFARGEPLVRFRLVRLANELHELVLVIHHAVGDGWSVGAVLAETFDAYAATRAGKAPDARVTVGHADYVKWVTEQHNAGARAAEAHAFFRDLLSAASEPATIAPDHADARGFTGRSERIVLSLEAATRERIERGRRGESVSMASAFIASVGVALARYAGAKRPCVGVYVSGRSDPLTETMVGSMVHTVPVVVDLNDDPSLGDLLRRVQRLLGRAAALEAVPIGELASGLGVTREDGINPFFRVAVSVQQRLPSLEHHGVTFGPIPYEACGDVAHDVLFSLFDSPEALRVAVDYRSERYDAATIAGFARSVVSVLEQVGAANERRASDVSVIGDAEEELSRRWVGEPRIHVEPTILAMIDRAVAQRGDHVAVAADGSTLTYRELDMRAGALAAVLRARGVVNRDRVAVVVSKSESWPIAVFAVLKAGACFVPFDARSPRRQLELAFEDATPKLVIADRSTTALVADLGVEVIDVTASGGPPMDAPFTARPDDTAYVIFTSGSTGRPKGVCISHASLVNLIGALRLRPGFSEDDVLFSVASIGFDMSIADLFLPLASGGTLAMTSGGAERMGDELGSALESSGATVMEATPSVWRLLLASGWTGKPDLAIWCGGEAMSAALATQLLRRGRVLWNMYGPTETTVWSMAARIDDDDRIGLGLPLDRTEVFVLQPNGQHALVGMPGEIWIGGAGVAVGYLNRQDLERERFRSLPLGARSVHAYRTGDLARPLANGDLEFIGRADRQVKLRGYRIELGELEAVACEHPAVDAAAATIREYAPGDRRLLLYYVAKSSMLEPHEMRAHLEATLPAQMIPAQCIVLEALPYNSSGKVDFGRLPQADADTTQTAMPLGDLERRVFEQWQTVLRRQDIDPDRQFFEQGGDSMLALTLRDRLERELGSSVPMTALYRYPTVRTFARCVGAPAETKTRSYEADAQRRGALREAMRERHDRKKTRP
jgi:amino acid adenylation domain-containing protein